MQHVLAIASTLGFLALALLASLIAGLDALKRGQGAERSLCLGAVMFLGQLGLFIVGAAVGLPSVAAYATALALGVFGALEKQAPEEA
jgi:hypothetical protein